MLDGNVQAGGAFPDLLSMFQISVLLNFYYWLLIERHLWPISHKWHGSRSTTNTLCFGLYSQNEAPFLADSNLTRARQFMFKGKN